MMGGNNNNNNITDESSNNATHHDSYSSSSTQQPLLSKPTYYPSSPSPSSAAADDDNSIENQQYPLITFNYGPRHYRDITFLILFLLFSLSTFAFGIFAIAHRNPNSSNLSSFVYDSNTSSCRRISPSDHHNPQFLQLNSSPHLVKDLIWTLLATFLLSGPLVLALLWFLRNYAKHIVYASIPLFVLLPVFFNVYWFVACTLSSTCAQALSLPYRILILAFVFLIIALVVWIIVANWHRIELTIRIIGVASDALARNLGLFGVLPSLVIALLLYFTPIVLFLVFSPQNGKIVPHFRKQAGSEEEHGGGFSCVWKQDGWVPAYFALAIITMIWSAAAMVEAQVYVISGTIAQWYFSNEDLKPTKSIRSSLRNAFGPSFGTVCFSGLLIAVVRVVRAAVDSARREDAAPGIVNLILRCCVNALLSAVDFLNKFTINFAAITGESYCSSAQMTYELLKRNLLSAVFVETVSTRILAGIIFVLSALYAIAVCAILKAVSDLDVEVYLVAVLAGLLLILVLGYFVHVLDNVIETVYVCFAIDRDKGEVFKQEVHDVYVHLPISRNHVPSLAIRTPLLV